MIGKYNKPTIKTALQKPSSETDSNPSESPTSTSESSSMSVSNLPTQDHSAHPVHQTSAAADDEGDEMEAPAGMEQPYHTWCESCKSNVRGSPGKDKGKTAGQGCSPPSLFARESPVYRDLKAVADSEPCDLVSDAKDGSKWLGWKG